MIRKFRRILLIVTALGLTSTLRAESEKDVEQIREVFSTAMDSLCHAFINSHYDKLSIWAGVVEKAIFDSTTYHVYKCFDVNMKLARNIEGNWRDTILASYDYLQQGDGFYERRAKAFAEWSMGLFEMQVTTSEAGERFSRAAAMFDEVGDRTLKINSTIMLCESDLMAGKYAEANYYARQMLAEANEQHDGRERFESLMILLRSYTQLNIAELVERYDAMINSDGWYRTSLFMELRYLHAKINYLLLYDRFAEAMQIAERMISLSYSINVGVFSWRTNILMARLLVEMENADEAQRYVDKCKDINRLWRINIVDNEFTSLYLPLVEAQIMLAKGKTERAANLISTIQLPKNMTSLLDFVDTYYTVSELISARSGDYRRAIYLATRKEELKKRSNSYNAHQRTLDLELAYQNDTTIRRQKAIMMEKVEDVSATQLQSRFGFLIAILALLASVLGYVLMMNFRRRQHEQFEAERRLMLEREVNRQTIELKNQNEQLNYQNHEVISSQAYARHIQHSIMPSPKELNSFDEVKSSFIIYKAADLLSGDFYWFRRTKGGRLIVCCADSWGRGVPGAMMSMVGITLLTETTMNSTGLTASGVLNTFNTRLLATIPNLSAQEGINCSVLIIDQKTRTLNVAMARQNALFLRDGEFQLLRGITRRIGDTAEPFVSREFEDHFIDYREDDNIYLFTDGATSLFGGHEGKKLKITGLQRILSAVDEQSSDNRQMATARMLAQWHHGHPENDDITLLGITLR